MILKIFKILIVLFALGYLFYFGKISPDTFQLATTEYHQIVLGGLLIVSVFIFTSHRLYILTSSIGVNISFFQTVRISMVGAFFNTFLLGGFGGDAIKMGYLKSHTNSLLLAVSTILFDRLIGLLSLIWLCGFTLGFLSINSTETIKYQTFYEIIFGSMIAGSCVLFFFLVRMSENVSFKRKVLVVTAVATLLFSTIFQISDMLNGRSFGIIAVVASFSFLVIAVAQCVVKKFSFEYVFFWGVLKKMPLLQNVYSAIKPLGVFKSSGRAVMVSFISSIICHVLLILAFYSFSKVLIFDPAPLVSHLFFAVPPALLANAMPVPGGGLGVGELAFDLFLGLCKSDDGRNISGGAVLFLFFRFWLTVTSLVGLPFYLFTKRSPRKKLQIK